MSKFLVMIPLYVLRVNLQFPQIQVRQETRACASLAVHKDHVMPYKVFESSDALGIAFGHDETLRPIYKVHKRRLGIGKYLFNVANVIFSCLFIQEMGTREVSFPALESHEPSHTAHVR